MPARSMMYAGNRRPKFAYFNIVTAGIPTISFTQGAWWWSDRRFMSKGNTVTSACSSQRPPGGQRTGEKWNSDKKRQEDDEQRESCEPTNSQLPFVVAICFRRPSSTQSNTTVAVQTITSHLPVPHPTTFLFTNPSRTSPTA